MGAWEHYLLLFVSALALTWVLTPLAGRAALAVGCVDRPGGRKIHSRNIPYFGGVALFLSLVLVLWGGSLLVPGMASEMRKVLPGFLLGGAVILATGLIDDLRSLRPGFKLAGQVAAGGVLALSGVRVEVLTNPLGGEIHLGLLLGSILTILWVVTMVNAINLIDGLDGLASGVTAIAALTLFAVALNRNDPVDAILTILLAGGCLGFLHHNFFPARIFLGDAGSLFLGFTLSVIGLHGVQKSATVMALLIPLSALAVPVLDILMAVVRRSRVRKNIFTADHEHLHHRLVRLGIRERNVVLLIYFFCIHLGITAFVLTLIPMEYTLMILLMITLGIMLGIKTLEFIEEKMALRLRESERESMVDRATGLSSFRYLTQRVIEDIKSCDRYENRRFSLLVFDLQGLEAYLRDLPDAETRDDCFHRVARFFRENIRGTDVVSHLGGESFVILTPEQGEGKAYLIERLKTIFENMKQDLKTRELTQNLALRIRAVEYPGNTGLVQELIRDAREVS